jgi:2',3'-cyclic-nucleotide 2'-phosphodiesterase (5'-nucleotidase family)
MNPETDGLVFADPAESVREHLPALRERADHVVVLAHLADCEPLADLPGVDAVLAGHTHDFEVEWVGGTPVVRQSNNGRHLAELELRPDGEPTAKFHAVAEAPVRDGVAEALSARVADAGLDEVVAAVDDPVERTEEAAFCGESRLGNFVADAYRWAAGTDVGLCSCGGPRTGDPLEGEVRAMDLVSVVPFDNELVVGELPGERLRETFEELRPRARYPDAPPEYVGHVSGARLRWADGELADVRVGGDPLDPDRTYTVATDGYVFETDHILSAFGDGDRIRTCGKQYDALVAYASEEDIAPEIEGRIRRE